MMGYEWLALAAACLWALSSMISVTPARHLGAFAYSRWRMGCVTIMLSSLAWFTGGWLSIESSHLYPMILSGLIGIFIGDTALFACFNRMGPRQAGLLFSCHALFSAILGYWLFNETLQGWELVGAISVFSGVSIAIFFGKKTDNQGTWDEVRGNIWIAIFLGLLAAFCQALGGVIAKPVMLTNADPIAASAIRMASAFAAHSLLRLMNVPISHPITPINFRILGIVALNGFLAMTVGMTLILYALQKGNVGMVALLSSTTPIMILPLLWLYTKKAPNRFAWLGAFLAVMGTGLIVS
ncbi:EamA family transporter [Aliivibrio fischeri]|uniref:EamA family transporter n=2 Tax=Aliivibrio fischeri TaxID=668 RepID=A0A510UKY2_ALIFS|nr:EamA family transporter [Aliivibrio fischeri]MUK50402.1 EamA family transporter [Aliivibrio fischeri]MUK66078.1 EamA family transporter [Aliivibrio fischeri]GEK15302.1 membrane protein [Aliivibrio fischeri]